MDELKLRTSYKLVATEMYFTRHAIVYKVKCEYDGIMGLIATMDNIRDKDLFLKTTLYDPSNPEVCFAPVNVTTEFYQGIFDKTLKNYSEYKGERQHIYNIGDVVGKVVV